MKTFLSWSAEIQKLNQTTIYIEQLLFQKRTHAASNYIFETCEAIKKIALAEWGEGTIVFFKSDVVEVYNPNQLQRAKFRLNKENLISTFE
jgi:hypothetical protein